MANPTPNQPQQNPPKPQQPQQNPQTQPQQTPQNPQPQQNPPQPQPVQANPSPPQNQPQPEQFKRGQSFQSGNQGSQGGSQGVDQGRVQMVGSTVGVDWSKLWNVVQKLSPVLQQVILLLLEQSNQIPMLAQGTSGQPTFDIKQEEVAPVAAQCGCDVNDLMALLQQVGPIIGKLVLAFLQSPELKNI